MTLTTVAWLAGDDGETASPVGSGSERAPAAIRTTTTTAAQNHQRFQNGAPLRPASGCGDGNDDDMDLPPVASRRFSAAPRRGASRYRAPMADRWRHRQIAAHLGVTRQRVQQLSPAGRLPAPAGEDTVGWYWRP